MEAAVVGAYWKLDRFTTRLTSIPKEYEMNGERSVLLLTKWKELVGANVPNLQGIVLVGLLVVLVL